MRLFFTQDSEGAHGVKRSHVGRFNGRGGFQGNCLQYDRGPAAKQDCYERFVAEIGFKCGSTFSGGIVMAPAYVQETEKISISIPSSLVEIVDYLSEAKGYSRSGFIRKAVENQILLELKSRTVLEQVYHGVFGE